MKHRSNRLCDLFLSVVVLGLAVNAESERNLLQVNTIHAAGQASEDIAKQAGDIAASKVQPTGQLNIGMNHNACLDSAGKFACLERQVPDVEEEGVLVIIPGLTPGRAELVKRNVKWLKRSGVPFECYIVVYREFPVDKSLFEPCELRHHEGLWLHHIKDMPLNATRKPFVLHFLDSVTPIGNLQLSDMIEILRKNELGHIAPTVLPCNDVAPGPHLNDSAVFQQACCETMYQQAQHKVGRFVDFIELQLDLFTREYFACFQDAIDPDNFSGWAFSKYLAATCGGRSIGSGGSLMGLLDHMHMIKMFHASYDYFQAEKEQRVFMEKHPGVFKDKVWANHKNARSLGELKPPDHWAAEAG